MSRFVCKFYYHCLFFSISYFTFDVSSNQLFIFSRINAKLFPTAEGYEDMSVWLEGESDCTSDLELWGVMKSKYTLAYLGEWLKKQKGKKLQWLGKSLAQHKIILYLSQVLGNSHHIYMIIYIYSRYIFDMNMRSGSHALLVKCGKIIQIWWKQALFLHL